MAEIQHHSDETRFVYLTDDQQIGGEIIYHSLTPNAIAIDSTKVNPELQGQGIAGQLLTTIMDWAKANHYQVEPICSYAKKKFSENRAYQAMQYFPAD